MHSKRTTRFFSHHGFTERAVIVSNLRSLPNSKQMRKTNAASIRVVFFSFFFLFFFPFYQGIPNSEAPFSKQSVVGTSYQKEGGAEKEHENIGPNFLALRLPYSNCKLKVTILLRNFSLSTTLQPPLTFIIKEKTTQRRKEYWDVEASKALRGTVVLQWRRENLKGK